MRQRSQTIFAKDLSEFLEKSEVLETFTRRQRRSITVPNTFYQDNSYEMRMDENELLEEINDINNYLHPHEESTDPKLLCSIFKEYIKKMSDNYCPIRASLKRNLDRALSFECLDKLDMKDCLENLVSTPSSDDVESGISSLFTQNVVLEEEIIKVMFISLNREERESVLKTFIGKSIEE
jgi:hypothetical protein